MQLPRVRVSLSAPLKESSKRGLFCFLIKFKEGIIIYNDNTIFDEINFIPNSETNDDVIEFNIDENNDNLKVEKIKKNGRTLQMKILSTFLVFCIGLSIFNVYIPVFNSLVTKPYTPPPPPPPKIIVPTFSFSTISSVKKISSDFEVINITDEIKTDYYIYLTQTADANIEFLNSVPDSVKNLHSIKVISDNMNLTFTKYLTITGWEDLMPDTEYALILTNGSKISKKQTITTKKASYIDSLSIYFKEDEKEKLIYVQPKINENFIDYVDIIIEFVNTSTNAIDGYGRTPKMYIDSSWTLLVRSKPFVPQYYKLKVYCTTLNTEDLYYTDAKLYDEDMAYLIYTHSDLILV